jgi:hypothetical protein
VRRVRDLPASGQQTKLWWRKRRLLCVEAFARGARSPRKVWRFGPAAG